MLDSAPFFSTRLVVWTPCKRCGRHDIVDTLCSHCGGHGMVSYAESVGECPNCGCSGEEWPPRCRCGAYRKSLFLELANPTPKE